MDKQKLDYLLKLIADAKKILRENDTPLDFVEMYTGKYTNDDELYTSGLAGCIVTLLYFEGDGTKEGILTHYPAEDVYSNVVKLIELQKH